MHDIDFHEALYLNFDIHDPCVRGSDSRVGPIWPYSKNVLHVVVTPYNIVGYVQIPDGRGHNDTRERRIHDFVD